FSGTPSLVGTYTFTVSESGTASTPANLPQTIVINNPATCAMNSGQIPLTSGNQNLPYSQPILTNNCTAPNAWSVTVGALPAGLTLNASTGVISGTPTGSGTSSFTVRVTDNLGHSDTLSTSINVAAIPIGPSGLTISTS